MSPNTPQMLKRMHAFSQCGQALIFTLLFAGVAALMGMMLFNSGMLANTKTRLQNAADAGAYSAGVLQARDHNFSAYTNRAMVANQVAVAQIVSLKSYLEDAKDTHDRMNGSWLGFWEAFPSSKPIWTSQKNSPAIPTVNSLISNSAGLYATALDKLIKAFSVAQQAHHIATLADMITVADEVITRNDPQAKLSSGLFSVGNMTLQVSAWNGYTNRHSANDTSEQADRFADVVVSKNSTDGFIRNRISAPLALWASQVSVCPGSVASFTSFGFAHTGGTLLSDNKKRWLAMDSTMGAGFWFCTYQVGPYTLTIGSPIIDAIGNSGWSPGGSGGGLAGADGGYDTNTGYKNNPWNTQFYGGAMFTPPGLVRRYSKGPGSTLDSGGGLQDYYRDVTDTKTTPKDQTPEQNGGAVPITIEAERQSSSIRTSSKIMPGSNMLKLDEKLAAGSMRTLSSAQSYFYRSNFDSLTDFTRNGWKRADNKTELANLFNPYWQARLADRTDLERIGSLADQMK